MNQSQKIDNYSRCILISNITNTREIDSVTNKKLLATTLDTDV